MGSQNSVPISVELENPSNVFTFSEQVDRRIADAQRGGEGSAAPDQSSLTSNVCPNCLDAKKKKQEQPKGEILTDYQKKLLDIENYHFEQKLSELEAATRKTSAWSEENEAEFQKLRSELVDCYKEYPKQLLNCHSSAKNYQKFVYQKQCEAILRNSQAGGDSANKKL